jgi:hypothetical protein
MMQKRLAFIFLVFIVAGLIGIVSAQEDCWFGACGIRVCKKWISQDGSRATLDQVKNVSMGIAGGVTVGFWPTIPANNITCIDTYEGANISISWWDWRGFQHEYKIAECEIRNVIPPKHAPADYHKLRKINATKLLPSI